MDYTLYTSNHPGGPADFLTFLASDLLFRLAIDTSFGMFYNPCIPVHNVKHVLILLLYYYILLLYYYILLLYYYYITTILLTLSRPLKLTALAPSLFPVALF